MNLITCFFSVFQISQYAPFMPPDDDVRIKYVKVVEQLIEILLFSIKFYASGIATESMVGNNFTQYDLLHPKVKQLFIQIEEVI